MLTSHRVAVGVIWLSAAVVSANEALLPPLSRDTLVGVWEASSKYADGVCHMEITKSGESYLAVVLAPNGFYRSVYRLVEADVRGGHAKLHFRGISLKTPVADYWIDGKGVGDGSRGFIDGSISSVTWPSQAPSAKAKEIYFMKGSWTRMMSHLSHIAEDSIRHHDVQHP